MNAPAPLRKGWCPGARRPMPTGDGLLVRLRLVGGILPVAQARAIAALARQFGNGLLDLTSRAHLQMRGLAAENLTELDRRLDKLGLIDADAAGEAVRNVLASPLAGLDAAASFDIRPVVAGLENRLATDASLHTLPAKFSFIVDDGGRLGLDGIAADIRFEAFLDGHRPRFAVHIGERETIGSCAPEAVPAVAAALARAFLALRCEERDGMRRIGSARVADTLLQAGDAAFDAAETVATRLRLSPRVTHAPPVGLDEAAGVVGVGVPFGRLTADGLDLLATAAGDFGAAELRLTPWRTVLIAGLAPAAARAAYAALGSSHFILEPEDPRLLVAACPGAPACLHATTPTQQDATLLAPRLARAPARQGIVLHISGCAKGCGQSGPMDFTLVGHDGRYDVVSNGTARDRPAATGLTLDEAAAMLDVFANRQTAQ